MPNPLHGAKAPTTSAMARHIATHECVLVQGLLRGNQDWNDMVCFAVLYVVDKLSRTLCVWPPQSGQCISVGYNQHHKTAAGLFYRSDG